MVNTFDPLVCGKTYHADSIIYNILTYSQQLVN